MSVRDEGFPKFGRQALIQSALCVGAFLLRLPGAFAGQGIPAAVPESQGVTSVALREMVESVHREGYDVRAMIVLRHGHQVLEWYAGGVTRELNHNIYSVTKSVVSTLTGVAIAEGRLTGTNVTLGEVYPNSVALRQNPANAGITLIDLLTMRSGLPSARANKPTGPERDRFQALHQAPDRTGHILGEPLVCEPGSTFVYGNAEPQLVLSIVEKSTGSRALPFAEHHLFGPMGFANYQWNFPDQTGLVAGGYGIRLRAIDMAKLGQLYLQGGRWGETQLVPRSWVGTVTRDLTGTGYGGYWWTGISVEGHRSYAARGVRGQLIQVIPDLELVFVMTANLQTEFIRPVQTELVRLLAQGSASNEPLPEDAEAARRLAEAVALGRTYRPAKEKLLDLPNPPLLMRKGD